MATSIRYRFTQKFPFSADVAFDWCTDFEPQDHTVMGHSNAERKVTRLSECALILDDVFHTSEGDVAKQKLVTLYPDRYSWVSTHLAGPNKYSQFIYQIASIKGGSELEFMGFHVEHGEKLLAAEVKVLAQRLCRDDADAWRLLAQAMAKELGKPV